MSNIGITGIVLLTWLSGPVVACDIFSFFTHGFKTEETYTPVKKSKPKPIVQIEEEDERPSSLWKQFDKKTPKQSVVVKKQSSWKFWVPDRGADFVTDERTTTEEIDK